MKELVLKLNDAMALLLEAQRDAALGDADAAVRQAEGVVGVLREAVALAGK